MIIRATSALLMAFMFTALTPLAVLGHAHLEESDPAAGETISTPYTLTASFSAEFDAERSFIRVMDAGGALVAEGAVSDDDATVMVVELPALEPGTYEVRWQTVTPEDNGVERDTFTFTVAAAATPSPTVAATATPSATAAPSATTVPSASVAPTSSPPASPTPVATAEPIDGSPSGTGTDLMLALLLAAVVIGAVLLFIFARNRR